MSDTKTCSLIIQHVQAELGPPQNAADNTGLQLFALLKGVGRELVRLYPWQFLNKDFTINMDGVSTYFALPSDWSYFVDQTQWDTTNHWPLRGPTSAQEWKWAEHGFTTTGPRVRYRVRQDRVYLWPYDETYTLKMEYIRSTWCDDSTNPGTYINGPTVVDDTPVFDWYLVVKFLKMKFWESKGFDSTVFRNEFLNTFFQLAGADKGAPVLSLTNARRTHLLDWNNVPDGNWNQ